MKKKFCIKIELDCIALLSLLGQAHLVAMLGNIIPIRN